MGNRAEAIQDYTEAIQRDPKDAQGYLARGGAYWSTGNKVTGQKDFQQAAQLGNEEARRFLRSQGIGW